MIFGIVSAVFLLLALSHVFFRKTRGKLMRRAHTVFGAAAVAAGTVHLAQTLPILGQRPAYVWITGVALFAAVTAVALSGVLKRRKWFKRHRALALLSVFLSIAHVGVNIHALNDYRQKAASVFIPELDISAVPDGVYEGEYDVTFISAKVRVTVKSGGITGVEIVEHRHDLGGAAERVADDIVIQQRVDVDAISGATNSSNVIKMAVYNALNSHVYP